MLNVVCVGVVYRFIKPPLKDFCISNCITSRVKLSNTAFSERILNTPLMDVFGNNINVAFEGITAVIMKNYLFWDITADYMTLYPRR
jgi:hypothetical protein